MDFRLQIFSLNQMAGAVAGLNHPDAVGICQPSVPFLLEPPIDLRHIADKKEIVRAGFHPESDFCKLTQRHQPRAAAVKQLEKNIRRPQIDAPFAAGVFALKRRDVALTRPFGPPSP